MSNTELSHDSLQVWPQGKVVFPDFFLNATQELWSELIVNHYNNETDGVTFDGLWIVSRPSGY